MMLANLGPISLPSADTSDLVGYNRRLSVMLYQYLRSIHTAVNATAVEAAKRKGYAPLTTGAEPIELVSDGNGQCVMVPYEV